MHSVKDDIPSQLVQSMNFQSTGQFACPVVHGALEPCVFGGKEGDSKDAPVVSCALKFLQMTHRMMVWPIIWKSVPPNITRLT